ncbi:hypothetical protein I350_00776 [Cryptococcus amylolentus CBS 6273]|uniref:Amino acid transporter transmembrane domain-containing protein n=1 Tax=Cryptococcus amylolentus CBS 6273 TaxID=1296118 RepID=A0A1E3KI37_9TREE|nr:hypothetical protein I350_00776 [Cryptococcus amylolentus CBS 6273]
MSDNQLHLRPLHTLDKDVGVPDADWLASTAGTSKDANKYDIDPFEAQREAKGKDYVEFRTMGWTQAGLLSCAENVAIGMLSFPSVFLRLGMVGGVIATVGMGVLSYITCWMIVDFKIRHPGVMHYGDAGGVMFGHWGQKLIGIGLVINSMGLAGSHVLLGKQGLAQLSSNAICSVWFSLITAVASVLMSISREFSKLYLMSTLSLISIAIASLIAIIGVGAQDDSVLVTASGGPIAWYAFPLAPTLVDIVGGVTNVLFSFGGNMAAFSFCSEMRRPEDFKKSFIICQGFGILLYTITGALVYAFGGQYVSSPALGMTTKPVKITAWVFAEAMNMLSGIISVNVGAKYLYIIVFRKKDLLTSNSWKARISWVGLVSLMWVIGFVIAEVIPFFNELLTILASIFNVWFTLGLCGVMWFFDNHPRFALPGQIRLIDTKSKKFFYVCSVGVFVLSLALTPLGMYSASEGIKKGVSGLASAV